MTQDEVDRLHDDWWEKFKDAGQSELREEDPAEREAWVAYAKAYAELYWQEQAERNA